MPFLCTKVNPELNVHLGGGKEKTIFYELRKHILTSRLKEDLLTAAIEASYRAHFSMLSLLTLEVRFPSKRGFVADAKHKLLISTDSFSIRKSGV